MTKRILHVVTNVAHYADPTQPTGLWLSELTHAYEIFAARGYQQRLVSPRGGESPLEPRALGWPTPTPAPRPGWPTRRAWRCWPTLPLPSRSTRRRSTPSISPAATA